MGGACKRDQRYVSNEQSLHQCCPTKASMKQWQQYITIATLCNINYSLAGDT